MNRRHSAALERAVLSDPTAFRILDRRPPHRAAPHRPLPRHARKPRPPTGAGRRVARPDRRLPDHHRPDVPPAGRTVRGSSPTTSPPASTPTAHDLHPQRRTRAERTAAALPQPHQRRRTHRNPTVKDEIAAPPAADQADSCSPTPSTKPPTSCSATQTSSPSASTSYRTSRLTRTSPVASTSATAPSLLSSRNPRHC